MVEIYKTTDGKVKGKWCHFQKEDFIRHGLSKYYWKPVGEFDPEEIKDVVVKILDKEGFVFYDKIEYKYNTYFGKLTEFAVNYFHIK